MSLRNINVLVITCLVACGSLGDDRPAAGAKIEPVEGLKPFAFLVGGKWTGTLPGGRGTDQHEFEWQHGGKFLRDRHIVTGGLNKYQGETIYAWDRPNGQVVYWYWASDGGFSTGTAKPDGNRFDFAEQHAGQKTTKMKTEWEKKGDHAYDANTFRQEGAEWKKMWTIQFRRAAE